MGCVWCGMILQRGQGVCHRCGAQQTAFAQQAMPVQPLAPKKKLVAISFMLLALCGAVFAFKSNAGHIFGGSPVGHSGSVASGGNAPSGDLLGAVRSALASHSMQSGQDQNGETMVEGSHNSDPVMTISAPADSPVFKAQNPQTGSTMQESAVTMPDDVRAYLEHVERCEADRMEIASSQLGTAMATMADLQAGGGGGIDMKALADGDEDAIPTEKSSKVGAVTDEASSMRAAWASLSAKFLAVPAPAECAGIRSSFGTAVNETGNMILEIVSALARSKDDRQGALQTLMGMQGKSEARIGRPSRDTDRQIGSICRKYSTQKWFDVKADVGGSLMGKL